MILTWVLSYKLAGMAFKGKGRGGGTDNILGAHFA